ncbi:MAG TPA: hypothetical protein VK541_05105 [Pedobacter sp.]|uniref:hypothetical protein n=1 Tax=Pedobacter sp. TaxID=1411316 RepID=UPI002CDEAE9A|nr:hypothetical protein [Pedobacter sp.]HMI01838.1 hypothetical protein [Pedobacter sp.]
MNYELITTDEKIFEALGMTPDQRPDFSKCREKDAKALDALYMMELAIEAINRPGFVADISDDADQDRYALWPDCEMDESEPSGFRFSYGDWATTYSLTDVGSRRLFESREKARHFWKYHSHHFIAYTTGNK